VVRVRLRLDRRVARLRQWAHYSSKALAHWSGCKRSGDQQRDKSTHMIFSQDHTALPSVLCWN
ncbi:MAG: hypothetical protein P8Y53_25380, partial [Pseudolabrys sp.]